MTNRFTGFKPEALAFLRDLAANNEASWFKPRKEIYESEVKAPMARLVAALAESLGEHGLPLTGDPLRSIFRIYRDIRFSRDKRPYRPVVSAALTRSGARNDPGVLYIHIEPGRCFLGAGFWQPPPELLEAWRQEMLRAPAKFLAVIRAIETKGYEVVAGGETRQRLPRGFEAAKGNKAEAYFLWNNFVAYDDMGESEALSPDLPGRILAFATACRPLLDYGWRLMPGEAPRAEPRPRNRAAAKSG